MSGYQGMYSKAWAECWTYCISCAPTQSRREACLSLTHISENSKLTKQADCHPSQAFWQLSHAHWLITHHGQTGRSQWHLTAHTCACSARAPKPTNEDTRTTARPPRQGRDGTDTQLDKTKLCTYVSWLFGVIAQWRGAKHKMKRKNKQKNQCQKWKNARFDPHVKMKLWPAHTQTKLRLKENSGQKSLSHSKSLLRHILAPASTQQLVSIAAESHAN